MDTSVTMLGTELPHPVLLAPTAFQRLAHPNGELTTARAAAATGSLLVDGGIRRGSDVLRAVALGAAPC